MEDIKGPLVTEFVDIALEYCRLMEQASKIRTGELFHSLQLLIPELYLKGSRLPRPRYCYEEEQKKFVKEDDYARLHDTLQQKVELVNGIASMSPGTRAGKHELMSFSLAENFADVYEELKNFVKLYEIGIPQAMNDAVWICRRSYEQSLGIRLLDGLKLLHLVIFNLNTEGARAIKNDDFEQIAEGDEEEPWFSDDQEEIYGEDE